MDRLLIFLFSLSGIIFSSSYCYSLRSEKDSAPSHSNGYALKVINPIQINDEILPGPVSLLQPSNEIRDQSLNTVFSWNKAENSNTSILQISVSPNFDDLIFDKSITGTHALMVKDLLPSTIYYWRVKSINNFGSGEWSSIRNFTTVDDPENSFLIDKIKENGLPVIEINTEDKAPIVSKDEYVKGKIAIHEKQNDVLRKEEIGELEIKGRGNSTWGFPKKSFRLKLADSKSILEMPKNRHWILLANYSDKSLLRNHTAFNLSEILDIEYTTRIRLVEVVLNGEYLGSYQLVEAIKIGKERVDINEINSTGNNISGGVILEVDVRKGENYNFESPQGVVFNVKDPDDLGTKDSVEINKRFEYIKNVVLDAENALYSENFEDEEMGYQNHLDISSFINWYLVNEIFKNNDAIFYTSVFMYFDETKKLTMGPVWDFDIAAGNINYNKNQNTEGFWIAKYSWYARLFKDPNFNIAVKERWDKVKDDLLTRLDENITESSRSLKKSQKNNFEKWPILGTYIWPNSFIGQTYDEEVFHLKKWLTDRIRWMDSQISENPIIVPPISNDASFNLFQENMLSERLFGYHPTSQLQFSILKEPAYGKIILDAATGAFSYIPVSGYLGEDSFSFISKTKEGTSIESFVYINVAGNKAPSSIFIDNLHIEEYSPIGTKIGRLYTEDEDEDDVHVYSFVSGEGDEDNSRFTLEGNLLTTNEIFDYKKKQFSRIRISSKDKEGIIIEKAFEVSILEVDKKFIIDENAKSIIYLGIDGTAIIEPTDLIIIPLYFNPEYITLNKSKFTCSDIGEDTIVLTYTDKDSYSTSAPILVHVVDSISPQLVVKDITVNLGKEDKVSISPEDVNNGSFDNCDIQELTLSQTEFNMNDYPEKDVILTAKDGSGNLSSAHFKVILTKSTFIYPNPANNHLTIVIDPNEIHNLNEIEILSSTGAFYRKFLYENFKGKLSLDITDLPPGLYLLKFPNTKITQSLKFVISR